MRSSSLHKGDGPNMRARSESLFVAMGDSLGVGVGARDGRGGYAARLHERLRQVRPDVHLTNLCVSGATSRALIDRQLPRAIDAAPALATVLIGINDVIRGVSPATFGANVGQIAAALGQCETRTLFCTVPDLARAPAAGFFLSQGRVQRSFIEERIAAFNRQLCAHAKAHGHAVLDLFGAPLREPETFFSADGFHPSEHGYDVLTEQLWPAFQRLLEADH